MSDGPRIGSLFSGYGGAEIGLTAAIGGTVAWHIENDPAAASVLAHNYPTVKNHGDITLVDWTSVEPVTWLVGGFPCQDVSVAGLRAGMGAGTRSGLWSYFAEAIAVLRPQYVLIENTGGLRSARADSDVEPCPWCLGNGTVEPALRALGAVLGDLHECGFDAEWCSVRASDVGAPHRRERVFILARLRNPDRVAGSATGPFGWGSDHLVGSPTLQRPLGPGGGDVPDTTGVGQGEGWTEPEGRIGGPEVEFGGRCPTCGCPTPHPDLTGPQGHRGPVGHADQLNPAPSGAGPVPDPESSRRSGGGLPVEPHPQHGQPGNPGHPVVDWGIYAPAITRWEQRMGRAAPPPTELSQKNSPVLSAVFTEFLMGLPAGHVTDVPGISRADMLKCLGNGVVPLQAQLALSLLLPLLDDQTGAGG